MTTISCPKCGVTLTIEATSAFGRVLKGEDGHLHKCNPEIRDEFRVQNGKAPIRHVVYPYKGARQDRLARKKVNEKARKERRAKEFAAAVGL